MKLAINISVNDVIESLSFAELEQLEIEISLHRKRVQEFLDNNPPHPKESDAQYAVRMFDRYRIGKNENPYSVNLISSAYYLSKKNK